MTQTTTPPDATTPGRRAWLPHLACLVAMLLSWGWHAVRHRDLQELEAAAAPGQPTDERLVALHQLLNRPDTDLSRFGIEFSEQLQQDPDPRIREFGLTSTVARLQPRDARDAPFQLEEVIFDHDPLPLDAPWWRQYVFYRRKVGGRQVGGRRRLNLQELAWYRAALRGEELPQEELLTYLIERVSEIQSGGNIRRGQ